MTKRSLFIGHGCPMNALATFEPGRTWRAALGSCGEQVLRHCEAILVISAHWQTRGTQIFATNPPHTIHDMAGFPDEIYQIQYPAPGAIDQASTLTKALQKLGFNVSFTENWGYDHGVWEPLTHLAPTASTPVFMLSIDRFKTLSEHLELARAIEASLDESVVVVGSGNIVHSLHQTMADSSAEAPDWAMRFDDFISRKLQVGDLASLTTISREPESDALAAAPTLEHYVPLIYAAATAGSGAQVTFPFTGFQNGTISMRCALFQGTD